MVKREMQTEVTLRAQAPEARDSDSFEI